MNLVGSDTRPRYVVRVDRELLDIDVVEPDETLKLLLNVVPGNARIQWRIARPPKSGTRRETSNAMNEGFTVVICRWDREENILTAPSLGKKLAPLLGQYGTFLAVEPENIGESPDEASGGVVSFKIRPAQQLWQDSAPEQTAFSGNGNGSSIVFRHDEAEDLMRQLAFLPRETEIRVRLHERGRELDLHRGFDTLLSLHTLRHLTPFPHQVRTVERTLRALRGRALLADEVGLGKTVEAGLVLNEYILRGLVRSALVLTPASLVTQWQEELIRKFDLSFVTHDSRLFKSTEDAWARLPFIVASLDTAKREPHRSAILHHAYDLVIVDEAHHLKNRGTLAWKFVSQLTKKYILLLTATPIENSMEELFNLITLLKPGQLQTASEYRQKYVEKNNPLKPKNVEELKRLIQSVMIRNRRSTTGIIEASRTAETLRVEPDPGDDIFYRTLSLFIKRRVNGTEPSVSSQQFVLRNLLRQAGSSRYATRTTLQRMRDDPNRHFLEESDVLDTLLEWARDPMPSSKMNKLGRLLQDAGTMQTVIFTGFLETQKAVSQYIKDLGIEVAEFHGGMSRGEKERAIAHFRDGTPVLVSTESGGEGRNLQFCHRLINFDVPWNPMRIEQRIGRIHRIGQTHDVYVANLVARGTIEEQIVHILDEKINLFQLVIGELDMILGTMEEQRDFEDMVWDIWRQSADEAHLLEGMETLGQSLLAAKAKYQQIKRVDDALFMELIPDE